MKKNTSLLWLWRVSPFFKALIMFKCILLLIFISTLQTFSRGYGQTKISINLHQVSFKKALKELEQKTDYRFLYNDDIIPKNKNTVTLQAVDASLEEVMAALLSGMNLTYKLSGNNLLIIVSKTADLVEYPVSGKVTDEKGEPLIGVSVGEKGTNNGASTDAEGNYRLNVTDANAVLVFKYIGFTTKEVNVNNQGIINVVLSQDVRSLDEVVVIGYGTVKKKDLTGSVSSITAERLLDKPAFNVGQALQGKIAGVQVIQAGGGVPGGRPQIRIRGSNSINTSNDPLFVVDGIVGVEDALNTLNPQDISAIDVLKDASATAIYGARGANGVIIITTKRGISGKTQVNYSGYVTRGTPNRHVYTVNADQMMYVYEQAMANADKFSTGKGFNRAKDFRGGKGTGLSYSEMPWLFKQVDPGSYVLSLIGNNGKSYAPIYNTDWEDLAFNPSLSNNHRIDFRGGNENLKFSLSLGYSNENGLMQESYQQRYSSRFTGDLKVFKWLDLNSQLSYTKSKQSGDGGITRSTAEVWPIVPVKYPDDPALAVYANRWGTNSDFNVGEQWYNIIFRRAYIGSINNTNQTTGSIGLTAHITKDLSLKSTFSSDLRAIKNNNWSGKLYGTSNNASINTGTSLGWQNSEYFNYDKTIGANHTINAVLGLEISERTFESLGGSNSLFFSDWYKYHNLGVGAATRPVPSSSDSRAALNSYYARVNYSYKGKYLFTATGRYDGSSKFGSNSKYGFFPSAGIAWKVSEEDFIKNMDAVSNLKLRASIGRTGNQEIGSFVTQGYVSSANVLLGGAVYPGIFPSSQGNNNLKWETTAQYDAGVELGLWNGRVNLEVDYYYKNTTDMLLSVPVPFSTSTGSIRDNFGSVQNKGWDFSLNSSNFTTQNFGWNTNISLSMNQNKITGLGPTNADIYVQTGAGNGTSVFRVGAPIGSFFGLNRLGTYSTEEASLAARYGMVPGDLKFQDKNQDGKIDLITDGDIIGRAFPKAIMGFNNNFRYKNFDAGIDISIVGGVQKAFVHESAEDRQLVSGGLNTTLTAWRPDNQNSMVAQVRPGNGGAYYQSYPDSHMIYDASFIRGSNATLGYSFSNYLANKMGVQKLRIYMNATNFFLITKAAGYDPEGSSLDKQSGTVPNQDKYQYPNPTNITLGLNVSF